MEHFSPSNIGSSSSQPEKSAENWTFAENKVFEIALANLPGQNMSSVGLLQRIDEIKVPGKTTEQIGKHLEKLIEDVNFFETYDGPIYYGNGAADLGVGRQNAATKSPNVCPNSPKKKVTRWTQDEHGKFLLGLAIYGKGDWKSISRHVVLTRSPTQVASHAQKYFIRLSKEKSASQTIVPPKSAENTFTISPSS